MKTHDNWMYVCSQEEQLLKGSRGTTNLKLKCKFCSRENSMGEWFESVKFMIIRFHAHNLLPSYIVVIGERVRRVLRTEQSCNVLGGV